MNWKSWIRFTAQRLTVCFSATGRPTFWTPIMPSAMRIGIWAYGYSDHNMSVYIHSGRVMNLKMSGAVPPIPHKSFLIDLIPRLLCRHLALKVFCWQWCWTTRTAQWLTHVIDYRRSGSQIPVKIKISPCSRASRIHSSSPCRFIFWGIWEVRLIWNQQRLNVIRTATWCRYCKCLYLRFTYCVQLTCWFVCFTSDLHVKYQSRICNITKLYLQVVAAVVNDLVEEFIKERNSYFTATTNSLICLNKIKNSLC